MTKMFKKLATATLGAAICLVAFKANPAQAATFGKKTPDLKAKKSGLSQFTNQGICDSPNLVSNLQF